MRGFISGQYQDGPRSVQVPLVIRAQDPAADPVAGFQDNKGLSPFSQKSGGMDAADSGPDDYRIFFCLMHD